MKIFYLLPLLVVFSFLNFNSRAQHTLTAAFNPIVGDIEGYTSLDTTGLFLGSSGTSQIWNYTSVINQTWTPSSYTYVPMSSVPNSFMFPGATIARDDSYGGFNIFSNNSTKFEEMGYATATASDCVLYSNPIKYYSLPFQYGSVSPDNFLINAATYTASGSFTTTGDGTGTLQLPSGNYTNILKLKLFVIETVISGTYVATYTVTECRYYSALNKFPLLTVGSQTQNVSSTITVYKYGQLNTIYALAINNEEADKDLSVFPNPVTNGELFIKTKNNQNELSGYISNILGQSVMQFNLASGNQKIELNKLDKGIYYLNILTNEGIKTKKLIIE